jgi:hypothetical protein
MAHALPLSSLPAMSNGRPGWPVRVSYASVPALYLSPAARPPATIPWPPVPAVRPSAVPTAVTPVAVPTAAAPAVAAPPSPSDQADATPTTPAASPSDLIARALRESTFFEPDLAPEPSRSTSAKTAVVGPESGGAEPDSSDTASREAALDLAERRLSFGLAAVAVVATLMAIVLFFLM